MSSPAKLAQAYGFETITVSSTAIGLTSTLITPANKQAALEVLITCETGNVRFRMDGTDPTSSVGHLLPATSSLTVTGLNNLKRLKFIRVSVDATLQVTFFY